MAVDDQIKAFAGKHKHALIFAGGIATAIIAKKVIQSQTTKNIATKGMAGVLSVKKDTEECFQDIKENAEDIMFDANAETKKEIYVPEN